VDTKKIINIGSLTPPSVTRESEQGPALQQEQQAQQESKSNKVRVTLLIDEDTVCPWGIFPKRKFTREPCTSACERLPVSSLMFGRDFTPADVASKRRRPKSRGRHSPNRGDRTFGEPFLPKPIVAQGQGTVDCRGCVPREHSNPRHHL